ncbi:ahpC/TSA family protein [Spiroplasma chinense]|uniref:thioredoxin-dependent peroxiredoxin n=1 Tax=Spiroplasma chinense TaxID=216932 RepID=A0A5B9Y6A1_9MOLU|nr:peroxiredoxin [Spiroplasma chinense]QEH62343.1 ahpC/TSA family protein [Spiroplasma chinense]
MKLVDHLYFLDTGEKVHLSSLLGPRGMVLFFYPRANTPWCTEEVKEYTKRLNEFEELEFTVVGISDDTSEDQNEFACDFSLDFPLIADTEKDLVHKLDVWGKVNWPDGSITDGVRRCTFILNTDLEPVFDFQNVHPTHHIDDVLKTIKENPTKF